MLNFFSSIVLLCVWCRPDLVVALDYVDVFKHNSDGYQCYRIPSILLTTNNTLVAFSEGRKYGCGDHGYIDIVYKTSKDFGHSWSSLKILYSNSTSISNFNTIGNPAPVQDVTTDKIFMLFSKNNKAIYVSQSSDDGDSWSEPTFLERVNNPKWTWVATGPPNSVQIRYNGGYRLITPIDWQISGMYSTKGAIVYSDDNGDSWEISQTSFGGDAYWPNESQAAQLANGSVLVNSRTGKNESWYRLGSISNDGGNTFAETFYIKGLSDTEGGCEGSMIMSTKNVLYYSGITPNTKTPSRVNLTLSYSEDEGSTWKLMETIVSAPSSAGYSALVEIPQKNTVSVLYERAGYQYISLVSVQQVPR